MGKSNFDFLANMLRRKYVDKDSETDSGVGQSREMQREFHYKGDRGKAIVLIWLFVGLLVFFIWASVFHIDQFVRASGQVLPSSRIQIVQAVDGGILNKLYVKEGQQVEKGELLAVLDKTRARSALNKIEMSVCSLSAEVDRLSAEVSGKPLSFGVWSHKYPEFISAEASLYEQKRKALKDEVSLKSSALSIAQSELKMQESLFATGDSSQLEVMKAKRQVLDLQQAINKVSHDYYTKSNEELTEKQAKLSEALSELKQKQDVLFHTDIVSPVKGTINELSINTVGGVLKAGEQIMKIAPYDDALFLEVKLKPSDVGQLKLNLPVSIKFDAYDYTIFGFVKGTLAYISEDTLTESKSDGASKEKVSYYRAFIKINKIQTNRKIPLSRVRQGMLVSVEVRTGNRTVMNYIAKPIVRAFSGSLGER